MLTLKLITQLCVTKGRVQGGGNLEAASLEEIRRPLTYRRSDCRTSSPTLKIIRSTRDQMLH
jgi:hypothetical protein